MMCFCRATTGDCPLKGNDNAIFDEHENVFPFF